MARDYRLVSGPSSYPPSSAFSPIRVKRLPLSDALPRFSVDTVCLFHALIRTLFCTLVSEH